MKEQEYNIIDIKELEKRLKEKGFVFKFIRTTFNNGDDYESPSEKEMLYIVNHELAKKISCISYFYFMWESLELYDKDDNEIIELLGDNVNREDKSIVRIKQNNICSPLSDRNNENLVLNSDVAKWLEFNGIDYMDITKVMHVNRIYKFNNVGDIVVNNETGEIKYHTSNNLVIDEIELERSLSEITDKVMATKIRYLIKELSNG